MFDRREIPACDRVKANVRKISTVCTFFVLIECRTQRIAERSSVDDLYPEAFKRKSFSWEQIWSGELLVDHPLDLSILSVGDHYDINAIQYVYRPCDLDLWSVCAAISFWTSRFIMQSECTPTAYIHTHILIQLSKFS